MSQELVVTNRHERHDEPAMNCFVYKGVLISTPKVGDQEGMKQRLFSALSYPGFFTPMYNVIGVEFGLGMLEIEAGSEPLYPGMPAIDEPSIVKIQLWNLNEKGVFSYNWTNFLRGSRFAIISLEGTTEDHLAYLDELISTCASQASISKFGIVVNRAGDRSAGNDLMEKLEESTGSRGFIVEDAEGLIQGLVASCITGDDSFFMLPVMSPEEIQPVESIINPISNHNSRVSRNLREFLVLNGYISHASTDHVLIGRGKRVFRIELDPINLYVAPVKCLSCMAAKCSKMGGTRDVKDLFTRICVVLDNPLKRGHASKETGFTGSDLFVLSMIHAIENDLLPVSVTKQFPEIPSDCAFSRNKARMARNVSF